MQVETWDTRRRQTNECCNAFSRQGTTTANFFYNMALTQCQLEDNLQQGQTMRAPTFSVDIFLIDFVSHKHEFFINTELNNFLDVFIRVDLGE